MALDIEKYKDMYKRFETLPARTDRITAYGSDVPDEVDDEVITDFYEAVCADFGEEQTPDWAEAYVQLLSWQFQKYHEGVDTFYENFYGYTSEENIQKTVKMLRKLGFEAVADAMEEGLQADSLQQVSQWIDDHVEDIYVAYLGIMEYSKKYVLGDSYEDFFR